MFHNHITGNSNNTNNSIKDELGVDKRPERYILRVRNVLQGSKRNCCLCLDNEGALWPINTNLLIAELSGCTMYPITEILYGVFGPLVPNCLLSDYICKTCKDAAVIAYTFINNTKKNLRVYEEYITQLDSKTTDLVDHCRETKDSIGNVLFVLDNPIDIMNESKKKNRRKTVTFSKSLISAKENDPRPYKCNMCEGEYVREINLKEHKYRIHKVRLGRSNYNCSICKTKFKDMQSLRDHNLQHEPGERHKCDFCDLYFDTRGGYLEHIIKSGHRHNRKLNGRRKREGRKRVINGTSPQLIGGHQRLRDDRNMNCSVCHTKFTEVNTLNKHLATHGPEEKHVCHLCGLEFDTRRKYLKHLKRISHRKLEDPVLLEQQVMTCDYCGYTSHIKSHLKQHIIHFHLDMSPYVCQLCGRKLITLGSLRMHIERHRNLHRGESKKRIPCEVCGKVFRSSAAVKKHHRLHTGERPYPCVQCDAAFRCSSDRRLHVQRVHEPLLAACPLCGLRFPTIGNLRAHVKSTHWKSDEKFDYRKIPGLTEADYELFKDGRLLQNKKN